jgi:splicing factor 3A subunit 3
MILEDQRQIHEDLERLEDASAELLLDEPKNVSCSVPVASRVLTSSQIRARLARDHEIARFLSSIEYQSGNLLSIYKNPEARDEELRTISLGDPMESFLDGVAKIKDFHRRYPNKPVENLEKAYKMRTPEDRAKLVDAIDNIFTGEEGFGRYLDLTTLHEQYLNLPVHQNARRLTYLRYLDLFDAFTPPESTIRRDQKKSEAYFQYLKALQDYLESFMRRTRPLENLDKLFATFDDEFEELWEKDAVVGWEKNAPASASAQDVAPDGGIWCSACKKPFSKETVYEAHLTGKKHKKALQESNGSNGTTANTNGVSSDLQRLKERAVAAREVRIKRLAAAMSTVRSDTKVNVERKQGMTERERQQEIEQLYSENQDDVAKDKAGDGEGEEKIYNPLKLPLDWSGKPIPFWLYKLHGLGVEFPCQICGNFVYMGRRAFDKHFNETRHIHGLKCLGITNTQLFREITSIPEATALWAKYQEDKKKQLSQAENVVEMEDPNGMIMPEKIYRDLEVAGLL